MAWTFDYTESAYYSSANFLDNVSEMSFAFVGRLDTVTVGSKQVPFGHSGVTNRAYFRKNNATPELMRWSVTSGGIARTVDDTWTPTANEPHHWALVWKADDAAGIGLYRDGVLIDTNSTATQPAYNSGGSVPLYLGAMKYATDFWRGTLECFGAWPGHFFTATEALQLAKGFPWYQIGGLPRPAVWYDMSHTGLTRIRDYSGNGRHITSTTGYIDPDVSYADQMWVRQMPGIGRTKSRHRVPVFETPPPPSDPEWTLWETILHPVAASTLTGLTNGTTYEVSLSALDKDGNESARGTAAEATPSVPAAPVVTYRIPWKRASRRSKYKKSQQ